jgi:alkylation response protein AidB-like acyl-CoA dehydrogenase
MTIAISEDHLALHETARRFVSSRCTPAVARVAMEQNPASLPSFWGELAELGWLGLHLDEADAGQGYGFAELVIVLEELGRAVAPGPFLTTVWASAVVRHGGGRGSKTLRSLADGTAVGTVALTADLAGERAADGSIRVSGTAGPVLCGAVADLVVAPVRLHGDEERWCVLRRHAFRAEAVDSVDLGRRVAVVTVDGGIVDSDDVLLSLDRSAVEAIAATMIAAECAGGAGWCLDTAASYAAVREQFGRPIGQFQAVKHRCADMLVAVEQARAVAWDGAATLDAVAGTAEAVLASAVAGAVAPNAYVQVAKDCIQVLGGIGFTWEHDAHLYLRRAMSVRQLLGGPSPWRRTVASSALGGTRRGRSFVLPDEAEAVRPEVAAFADSLVGLEPQQQRTALVDAGYFVPHWAPPWGRDAGPAEQLVIEEELRRVRVRRTNLAVGAWAAPTIATHGTVEQQERWVRPTLLGEIQWCQLFSEPGAGSDLAALTTSATRTDGGWLLNGQKVWTSLAREADWGICLVRTDRSAPKHLGITYVIVDMKSNGIDIRPLRELTGFEMFNEIFLNDVFVPDDCVIGEVNGGWPLARTTLANERVAMGSGSSFGGGVEALLALVTNRIGDGRLVADALLLDQLGAMVAEAQTVALLGLRSTHRSLSGAAPGPEASVRKLLGVEHDQRTQELGLVLLGPEGATAVGDAAQWSFGFLANRCLTIAGGTSEIQRNVIGERLLGLPRDPEAGRT